MAEEIATDFAAPPQAPLQPKQETIANDFAPPVATDFGRGPDLSQPDNRDAVERSYIGRIWDAFRATAAYPSKVIEAGIEGAVEAYGLDRPLGWPEKTLPSLQRMGLARKGDEHGLLGVLRAADEVVYWRGAQALDFAMRTPSALYTGLQEAGMRAGLPRDVVSIPDSIMGTPHPYGVPTAVEQVLSKGSVRRAIDGGTVDRTHHVPYEAGASKDSDVTHIDKSIPEVAQLPNGQSFDTAKPLQIHEQVEKDVEKTLTAGGMSDADAHLVAHWNFAEQAEDAWYIAQGIDPLVAEKWWQDRSAKIQHEPSEDTPPDLWPKPYPHDSISAASTEADTGTPKPTEEMVRQANEILSRQPDHGEVSPDNILNLAKDLGVIGPEKPPRPPDETPAQAAQRTIPARQVPGDKVTMTPNGEPLTAWEARFKDWTRRLKSPEDVKQFIEDAAAANNNFPEARAGAIDPAHLEVVADAAGVHPTELNRPELSAKFNSADKVRMIKQALDQTLQDFKEAADNYASDQSPGNLAKMLKAELRRDYVVEYAVGMRADWAHFGHALRDLLEPRAPGEEAPPKEKPAAPPSIKKELFDVTEAATDVAKNIAKPGANQVGLMDLIDAAQKLVGAEAKIKRPKGEPLQPEIAELVKTAQAVKNLIPKEAQKGPFIPTVRPLRKLLPGQEPEPTSPLAKFNALITEAEKNVTEAAQENEATARAEMLPEIRDLMDAAKRVSDFFGGAGLERRVQEILFEKARSAEQTATLAKSIKPLTMEQTAQLLAKMRSVKPTLWDKYLYYWTNALISGPVTHLKYIGANAAFAGVEAGAVTPLAGVSGTIRRAVTGTREGVFLGEGPARLWGLVAGTPDAIRAAWQAAKSNAMTPLPGETSVFGVNPLLEHREAPITGKLGMAISLPSRNAAAIHSFFRFLGFRAEIESRAYRQAAKEGLSPLNDDFWQRRQELAGNLDLLEKANKGATAAAIDNGDHLTFIREPGKFGQFTSRIANAKFQFPGTSTPAGEWQPFKLLLPFTRIPGQIMRATTELTPVNFVDARTRADLLGKNGAAAQDMAIGRWTFGAMASGMIVNWALNDNITGYGPTDPNERQAWLLTHQPYSIKLNGYWYSYNKFGPLGDLMGLVANLTDVAPHLKEGELTQAAAMITKATAHLIEDEVGMQSLANAIEALDDHDRKMGRFLSGQVGSNMPYSSMFRQAASITDPTMREAKTFIDQLRYNIPWARQELLPKRDYAGRPIPNPGYGSIIRQGPVGSDPLDLELQRLQIKPTPPGDRVNNVKLTPELYDEKQRWSGANITMLLHDMVQQPAFQSMPDYVRETRIRDLMSAAHGMADSQMIMAHPELIGIGLRQRLDHIMGASHTSRPKNPPPELTHPLATPATPVP